MRDNKIHIGKKLQILNYKMDKIMESNSIKIFLNSQETIKSLLNIMEKQKKSNEKEEIKIIDNKE